MAVSDVQLDTGIGVGKAQVFKPLDVQELFDAQQKKKANEELAKANKLKEQEAKKAKVKAQVDTFGALKGHREALDAMAKEILLMTEKNPDDPELPTKLYNYGVAGRTVQDVYNAYNDKQKTLYKDTEKLIYGMEDLEDGIAELSDLAQTPDFNLVESAQNIGARIQNVKAVDREKYVDWLQNTAKKVGEDIVKTMGTDLTSYESKKVAKEKQKEVWDHLVSTKNYVLFNGVKQQQKEDPSLTEKEALERIKPIWDNAFDTMTGMKLDKKTEEKEWKPSPGGGNSMQSDIYRAVPSITTIKTAENTYVPETIEINSIIQGEPKEIRTEATVVDENGNKSVQNVVGSAGKWKYIPGRGYTATIKVPVVDDNGKPSKTDFNEYEVVDFDGFNNEIGTTPNKVIQGLGGHKVFAPKQTGAVAKKPTAKKYKFTKVYNGATYGRDKETDSWKKITT